MKQYLVILIISISLNSSSQFFSKKVETTIVYEVTSFDLQATDSSYLFGSTEIQLSNNFHRLISIIKTNLNGEIVSSFKYETNDSQYSISCKSIVTLADGNILISALYSENNTFPISPVLILLDATGNVTWSRELNLYSSTEGIHIQKLSDNSILGIVNDNDATLHPILFKIDNNGAVLSPMELSNTPFGVTHIIPNSTNFDLLFTDGNLLTIENDLSSIHSQTKYYHQSGMNFGKTSNGDYIIVASQVFGPGYLTISRTNAQGVVLWSKHFESWVGATQNQGSIYDVVRIHFVTETADGNIVVSANSEGGLFGSFQLILDQNGNYISNYKTTHFQNKMLILENDEFLATGTTGMDNYNSSGLIFERRPLATKFDCDNVLTVSNDDEDQQIMPSENITISNFGQITSNALLVNKNSEVFSTINQCEISLSISNNSSLIVDIYPNPASEMLTIECEKPLQSVTLTDVTGKMTIKYDTKTINISSLPNGIYFLSIVVDNEVIQRKIEKF